VSCEGLAMDARRSFYLASRQDDFDMPAQDNEGWPANDNVPTRGYPTAPDFATLNAFPPNRRWPQLRMTEWLSDPPNDVQTLLRWEVARAGLAFFLQLLREPL
jgi:hypothetical protein